MFNFCYFHWWGKSVTMKSLNNVYFSNDTEENCHWIVKIKWAKTFWWANQQKFIPEKLFSFYSVLKCAEQNWLILWLQFTESNVIFVSNLSFVLISASEWARQRRHWYCTPIQPNTVTNMHSKLQKKEWISTYSGVSQV